MFVIKSIDFWALVQCSACSAVQCSAVSSQIVVDLSGGPEDAFAYISDFASGGIFTFR